MTTPPQTLEELLRQEPDVDFSGQRRSSLFFQAQDLEIWLDSLDRQLNEVDNSALKKT